MSRLHKLFLLPQAVEDFQAIYEPLRSAVVRRLQMLKRFPRMGVPLVRKYVGWRATTVGVFRIIYRVTARGIEVGYIRHCKRGLPGESKN